MLFTGTILENTDTEHSYHHRSSGTFSLHWNLANSYSPFKSQLKCHILREAFSNPPVKIKSPCFLLYRACNFPFYFPYNLPNFPYNCLQSCSDLCGCLMYVSIKI